MYYYRIVELEKKILQMDQEIQQIAQSEPYAEPVGRLRCFRGIDWLVALARVCEIGSYLCTSPTGSARKLQPSISNSPRISATRARQ